ncbi:MAG: hypothetical protein HYY06_12130 [Deltaproteobacteria bacterium]|nr:hypothetical protein [Deltaproteobacteria bacterium]
MLRAILPVTASLLAACASAAPAFPASTSAELVGTSCGSPGRPCRCVESGETLGEVPAGKKRFEVRLPQISESDTGVSLAGVGDVVRPSGEQGDRCFYIDLEAGRTYAVTVHGRAARRERGLSLGYTIREYNPRGPGFYTIIDQVCGDATAACPIDDPSGWTSDYQSGRGRWDPCSSTRVEGYTAQGGFYDRHPTDAQISFALKVYEFEPRRLPGAEGCPR